MKKLMSKNHDLGESALAYP